MQRSGPPCSLWGTAIADQVMLESHIVQMGSKYPLFVCEFKFVVRAIP